MEVELARGRGALKRALRVWRERVKRALAVGYLALRAVVSGPALGEVGVDGARGVCHSLIVASVKVAVSP